MSQGSTQGRIKGRWERGVPMSGMEYSPARKKKNASRAKRAKNAIPLAGPVTVTKADGTTYTKDPKRRGVDTPRRGIVRAREWAGNDDPPYTK